METNELKAALIDVRKAYRLLYQYHRRVIDTARLVHELLAPSSAWAGNQCSVVPMMSNRNLLTSTNWIWDATPLVGISFLWKGSVAPPRKGRPGNGSRAGDYLVDVNFDADTEFSSRLDRGEPDPTTFGPPDTAQSTVRITVAMANQDCSTSVFDAWESNEYPTNDTCTTIWDEAFVVYSELFEAERLADETAITRLCVSFTENMRDTTGVVLEKS